MWAVNAEVVLKTFWQMLHSAGFSPVCIRSWCLRLIAVLNSFGQYWHWNVEIYIPVLTHHCKTKTHLEFVFIFDMSDPLMILERAYCCKFSRANTAHVATLSCVRLLMICPVLNICKMDYDWIILLHKRWLNKNTHISVMSFLATELAWVGSSFRWMCLLMFHVFVIAVKFQVTEFAPEKIDLYTAIWHAKILKTF